MTGGAGQGGDPRSDGTAALLAMRRLRRLAVQQQSWSHAEVEQLLAAKEARLPPPRCCHAHVADRCVGVDFAPSEDETGMWVRRRIQLSR